MDPIETLKKITLHKSLVKNTLKEGLYYERSCTRKKRENRAWRV